MIITKSININRLVSGTGGLVVFNLITSVLSFLLYKKCIEPFNFEIPVLVPTILGTALSFFIGFNNNQAYDRWWEARKIWGAITNESRTFTRQILSYTNPTKDIDEHQLENFNRKLIYRHLSFLYALKENLRKTSIKNIDNKLKNIRRNPIYKNLLFMHSLRGNLKKSSIKDIDNKLKNINHKTAHENSYFLRILEEHLGKLSTHESYKKYINDNDINIIESKTNKANSLLDLQTMDIEFLYKNKIIDGFKFMELNKSITKLCDEMGKSERIASTIFPTTYNFYTRIFIWFFIVTITLVSAKHLNHLSILLGVFIGYVFLTIQKIGLSLLNPFENIIFGVPLDNITRNIEINLLESINDNNIPKPIKSINGEYLT